MRTDVVIDRPPPVIELLVGDRDLLPVILSCVVRLQLCLLGRAGAELVIVARTSAWASSGLSAFACTTSRFNPLE
jgi:hypothetical protein